VLCISYAEKTN